MPERPLLSLENITFAYANRPPIFDGLNLALHEGEHIGLYGPNGCGKTTLLRLIMGLEVPQSGAILFHGAAVVLGTAQNGQPDRQTDKQTDNPADTQTGRQTGKQTGRQALHRMRCAIGFVLQNSDEQLFSPTVLEDVAFGPLNLGLSRKDAKKRAMETLESMDIAALAERPTHHLSGGEKKMVSIASVLSMQPEALLLDEPTAFLDEDSQERIVQLLQKQKLARIVVSHDKDFLAHTASSYISITHGAITPFLL